MRAKAARLGSIVTVGLQAGARCLPLSDSLRKLQRVIATKVTTVTARRATRLTWADPVPATPCR